MNVISKFWSWVTTSILGRAAENAVVDLANRYIKTFFPALPLPTAEQWNALIEQLGKIHRGSEFVVVMEKFAELVIESSGPRAVGK
jgi:hypothetical protein